MHLAQRGHLPSRGLRLPRRQPLRLARVPASAVDLPGLRLGPAGYRRRLLVHQPACPLRRRVPVLALIGGHHPLQLRRQSRRPRREQVHDLLRHPADLTAVPVGPRHHRIPPGDQPGLHLPVNLRRDRQPLVMQRPGVQPPVIAVGPVGPLHQVRDRDVHVQLRVPVPADVMSEHPRDQPGPVPPLPRGRRVVPGPGIARLGLGALQREPRRGFQVRLDPVRLAVQLPRGYQVTSGLRLLRRDLQRGMQHRDALGRRHRQVVIRHRGPRPGPRLRHRLGHLGLRGERVRRPERRLHTVIVLRLAPRPGQPLPARPDVLHVEPVHHRAVHRPGQPEGRGALARPPARRLPRRGVVAHRPGVPAVRVARCQVAHVVTRVQRRIRRHGGSPSRHFPTSSSSDACLG